MRKKSDYYIIEKKYNPIFIHGLDVRLQRKALWVSTEWIRIQSVDNKMDSRAYLHMSMVNIYMDT